LVEHAHASGGNGAQGQLFMTRHAHLTNDEDVKRRSQIVGDFKANRNAAARQGEHQNIRIALIMGKLHRQLPAGVVAVAERQGHQAPPLNESSARAAE
jgi:hypothetical protein